MPHKRKEENLVLRISSSLVVEKNMIDFKYSLDFHWLTFQNQVIFGQLNNKLMNKTKVLDIGRMYKSVHV